MNVEWTKTDRYRRKVGKVTFATERCNAPECPMVQDANLAMILAGVAWHYKQYEREQSDGDRVRYAEAEETARAEHIGLWRDPNPEAPWDYRKRNKLGKVNARDKRI